jgi:Histidine kinase-like ATPase domain
MEADDGQTATGRVRLELAPNVHAPAAARRALRGLPLGDRRDEVLLLASELVTNAVLHGRHDGGRPILFEATCDGDHTRIEVRNAGPGFAGAPWVGHGLKIVDEAADRWGVEHDEATHVWFELPMGRGGFEPPSVGL